MTDVSFAQWSSDSLAFILLERQNKTLALQWWHMPIIPALGRQRQVDLSEFKANLLYKLVVSVGLEELNYCKGKQSLSLGRNDVVQLKEAFKWITHPLFSEELGVPIDGKSLFEVSVVFAHPETVEDCHFLGEVCPDCFKPAKNKQSVFTRMAVLKALNKIKEDDFLEQFPCPPNSPKTVCTVLGIECTHGAVFVAGRYNKYSRNLPQTPWIIDGERKMESSVEELISDHLLAIFKAESFNFSSSGREDVDVRTLGNGRPFAVELLNPHRVHFTPQEVKELQQKINKSSDKIQVRDLQLVTREAMGYMKEGEEEKSKTYSALIWTNRAIQEKDIGFLNDLKDLKIDQKTPLRVLHRRPLAVRTRAIHSMETRYLDEHHFRLYLKTQAGTYPSPLHCRDLTRMGSVNTGEDVYVSDDVRAEQSAVDTNPVKNKLQI
ncbi:hypothetical protein STEG23_015603 [Scotinomys teguina]